MFSLFVTALSLFTLTHSILYPSSSQRRPDRRVYYDADDADDKVNWSISIGNEDDIENKFKLSKIIHAAGKVAQIGKVLGYDAEDVIDGTLLPDGTVAPPGLDRWGRPVYLKSIPHKFFDAEDIDDGINWGEITKIAGQVNQIGQILGFDAEDIEDAGYLPHVVPLDQNVVRQVQEASKKQKEKYDKKRYEQMVQEKLMELKAQKEAEEKFARMYKGRVYDAEDIEDTAFPKDWLRRREELFKKYYEMKKNEQENQNINSYDAEDSEDKVNWSISIGNEDEDIENKFKIGKIFHTAGKLSQIGKVLGYDTDPFHGNGPDSKYSSYHEYIRELYKNANGRILASPKILLSTNEDIEDGINWSEITKIAGQVNQIGQILGFDTEESTNPNTHKYPTGFIWHPRTKKEWLRWLRLQREQAQKISA